MKKLIVLFILISNINICVMAQVSVKPIDLRFVGKEEKLRNYLVENLMYPISSVENCTIGLSIVGLTVTPEGKIYEVSIINSVDKSIDNAVKNVLKSTKKKWENIDSIEENQTFYIQVIFDMHGSNYSHNVLTIETDKYNFIKPIVVKGFPINNELPETDEEVAKKCNDLIKQGEYKKSLKYTNELIKRNPLIKDYYQLRIFINKKLGKEKLIIEDSDKLNNFIKGISLSTN